jgi:uncharacterized membrane protein
MRKEITKKKYVRLTFGIIILGVIIISVLTYLGMTKGFDYYISNFVGLGGIITGVGIGMSLAYTFKIKDYQYN